jgi:hypothetical protein
MTGKWETENELKAAQLGITRRLFGGVIGAGALIVAGCGGGGGGDDGGASVPPPPPPPPASLPQITVQPTAQAVAQAGQTARFSVQVNGDSPQFQWKRNGIDIAGANASVYEVVTAAADDGTQFSVAVSNAGGTVVSNPVALTVGLSFNLAAALHNYLFEARNLQGIGPNGAPYSYQQSVTQGASRAIFFGTQRVPVTDAVTQIVQRFYGLDASDAITTISRRQGAGIVFRSSPEDFGRVTSYGAFPQSARIGATGPWYSSENSFSGPITVIDSRTIKTYSLEVDSSDTSKALLKLKEVLTIVADGSTVQGEVVLRINAVGAVTLVSDSSIDRAGAIRFE